MEEVEEVIMNILLHLKKKICLTSVFKFLKYGSVGVPINLRRV